MRVFENIAFHRWSKKAGLTNEMLRTAIDEIGGGRVEANLGGHVFKKRIALDGKGKRGGARTIVAFKLHDKAFFLYGFAKSNQENINNTELIALKKLAKIYFNYTDAELDVAVQVNELVEVKS